MVDKKLRSAISTFYEVQNLSSKPMTAPLFTNPSGGRFTANAVVKQFAKMYKEQTCHARVIAVEDTLQLN